jgi:transposase
VTTADAATAGLTVAEVARRFRVGEDKVRSWIKSGELAALNTASALCGRPRFVVTPDALAAFERRRSAAAPKPARRRRPAPTIDYYP